MEHPIAPGWRLSLQAWLALFTLGLAFWFVTNHWNVVLETFEVLFAAILVALALRPLAELLRPWRVTRSTTVLGVYAILVVLVVVLARLLVPVVVTEVALLQSNGPQLADLAVAHLSTVPLLSTWVPSAAALQRLLAEQAAAQIPTLVTTVAEVGHVLLDVVIVLVLAYFFVTDGEIGDRVVLRWIPLHYRDRAKAVLPSIRQQLSRWVWAQLGVAAYFGVVFSIGLTLLGVPFAVTIGFVGGILEVIPYFGGLIAVLLAMVSALSVDPMLAVWVFVFYTVVVNVEAHVLGPMFFGHVVGLHPALVLIALVIGLQVAGILGVFFAVPVTVVIVEIVNAVRAILRDASSEIITPG